MKTDSFKKLIAFLLCLVIFTGCGKNTKVEIYEPIYKDRVFLSESRYDTLKFNREVINVDGYNDTVIAYTVADDYFFFYGYNSNYFATDIYENETARLYYVPITGGTAKEYESLCDNTSPFRQILTGADNCVYLENEDGYVYKLEFDFDAGRTESTTVYHHKHGTYLFTVDKEGNLYFTNGKNIIIVDPDNGESEEITGPPIQATNTYVNSMCSTNDGEVVAAVGHNGEIEIYAYDKEENEWGDYFGPIFDNMYNGIELIPGSGDYDFYYVSGYVLYGFIMSEGLSVEIMDFASTGTERYSLNCIYMYNSDCMFALEARDFQSREFVMYTRDTSGSDKEKQTITLACFYSDLRLNEVVNYFNENNDKYKIEYVNYNTEENPEKKMDLDIYEGHPADIYFLDNMVGSYYHDELIENGFFADLSPYFNSDPDVNKDTILPGVYEALKEDDGSIYFTAGKAGLVTFVAEKGRYSPDFKMNIDDFEEFLNDEKKQGRNTFDGLGLIGLVSIIASDPESYYTYFEEDNDFDSEKFTKLLELYELQLNLKENNGDVWLSNGIAIGDKWKCDFMYFMGFSPSDYKFLSTHIGDEPVNIGFPIEGYGSSCFEFSECYGISSACENKDAAWEFVKLVMNSDYQQNNYANFYQDYANDEEIYEYYATEDDTYDEHVMENDLTGGKTVFKLTDKTFPTRKDAFLDCYLKVYTQSEIFTDKAGREVYPGTKDYTIVSPDGGTTVNMSFEPLTEDEAQKYYDFVNCTHERWRLDPTVNSLIMANLSKSIGYDHETPESIGEQISDQVGKFMTEGHEALYDTYDNGYSNVY